MNRKDYQRVKKLFHSAREMPVAARSAFLDEQCSDNTYIRREIEKLLDSYDSGFLEDPAAGELADLILESGLEAGQTIGHYEVREKIGAGGMGEVFLAEDLELRRLAALKILPVNFADDADRTNRFIQEARSASALNHPNIFTIYEVGVFDDFRFIATEYIRGETLREILVRKGQFTIAEALDIAVQISAALDAAHTAGIVHRDIKPENIMIREDGLVKVLDFGLAKVDEESSVPTDIDKTEPTLFTSRPGMVMGTAAYMSPEQARGSAVDERTDIWSLGVVLYEMIAGRTPFAGDSVAETFANLINKEPPPLARLAADAPDALQKIVSKTLRKNREERYQTAADLLRDLKNLHKQLEFEAEYKRPLQTNDLAEASTRIMAESAKETLVIPANNLPAEQTTLIGREKEIAEIKNLLSREDIRLLTLTGVGGTGKTTLAKAVAGEMLADFTDGVYFLDLAALTNAELVASTVAQTLGVKEAGGKSAIEMLKDYLRGRQILLVMDNFEQILDAAPQIDEMLSAVEELKILITSRALLRLNAEREFIVPPLALPDETAPNSLRVLSKYDAVKFFAERARSAKPNFALTDENAQTVAAICRRLDGLPLAIELAAARIKILSPQAILSKLEKRLSILTGGARDLPARQQTMRDTLQWSYDLLTEDEKKLFRRLAVFAGGFTFEAAEAVCENYELTITNYETFESDPSNPEHQARVLDSLTSLVEKSLIVAKDTSDGTMRFRMLEVVHEYALEFLEKSGEAEERRQNHAIYYLALAEKAEPDLRAALSARWLNCLEQEHDNLRTAFTWLFEQDIGKAALLAAAMRNFWISHSHLSEGREWLEAILKNSAFDTQSTVYFKVLWVLGSLTQLQGEYKRARELYEEGLKVGKAANDFSLVAKSNLGLGMVALQQGDFTTARKFIEESLAISRKLDYKLTITASLNNLGDIARAEGDNATAQAFYEESLVISKQIGDKPALIANLQGLGAVAHKENNYELAHSYFVESLMLARESEHKIQISNSLDGFAAVLLECGKLVEAAQLAGATDNLHESTGYKIEPAECRFRDDYLSKLHGKLSESDFADAYQQGRKLDLDKAIALALSPIIDLGKLKDSDSAEQTKLIGREKQKTIAILPFKNLSGDAASQFYEFSLADAVTTELARLRSLIVRPSSVIAKYQNKEIDAREAGKEMQVNSVLSASFIHSGTRLRVTAQLLDVSTGDIIWSDRIDSDASDIFALQDAITQRILDGLKFDLTTGEKERFGQRPTKNNEAYEEYLRGRDKFVRFIFRTLSPADCNAAIDSFKRAVELDPKFALAWSGLGACYANKVFKAIGDLQDYDFAETAFEKAIALDPNIAEARVLTGIIYLARGEKKRARAELARVYKQLPNDAAVYFLKALMHRLDGEYDESLRSWDRLERLDPSSAVHACWNRARIYSLQGDNERALKELDCGAVVEPNHPFLKFFRAQILFYKGEVEEATRILKTVLAENPHLEGVRPLLAMFLAAQNKPTAARKNLSERALKIAYADYDIAYWVASAYALLGEKDAAFEWLEHSLKLGMEDSKWLENDRTLDSLRGDKRYVKLLQHVVRNR